MNDDSFNRLPNIDENGSAEERASEVDGVLKTTLLALFMMLVGLIILSPTNVASNVRGAVEIGNGYFDVKAKEQGTIDALYVRSGDLVSSGAVIAKVDSEARIVFTGDSSEVVRSRNLEERSLLNSRLSSKLEVLDDKIEVDRRALDSSKNALNVLIGRSELARDRQSLALDAFERANALHREKLVSTTDMARAEDAMISAKDAVLALKSEIMRSRETIREKEHLVNASISERKELLDEAAAENSKISLDELQRVNKRLVSYMAPASGRVQDYGIRVGDLVQPGEILFSINPERREVVLNAFATNEQLDQIRIGQTARFTLSSRDESSLPVFYASVIEVSRIPIPKAESSKDSGPQYRIRLLPDRESQKGLKKLDLVQKEPVDIVLLKRKKSPLAKFSDIFVARLRSIGS